MQWFSCNNNFHVVCSSYEKLTAFLLKSDATMIGIFILVGSVTMVTSGVKCGERQNMVKARVSACMDITKDSWRESHYKALRGTTHDLQLASVTLAVLSLFWLDSLSINWEIPINTLDSASVTMHFWLTHWGRVTYICVGKITIIGSDNGLSPGRRQAIIQTNDGILLTEPLGTNFNEIWSEIHTFSFKKMHLKLSSAKWRPFCLGLNVLMWGIPMISYRQLTVPCTALTAIREMVTLDHRSIHND